MAIIKEQFEATTKRGELALKRGPVARSAHYDSKRGRVVIELGNGCEFAFPARLAEGLAGASQAKLSKIKALDVIARVYLRCMCCELLFQ